MRAAAVGAEAATLTFMAGGGEGEFAEARPLLEAMGKDGGTRSRSRRRNA
ncbi:NAD(P)-binding domain-containing protein [Streptomyces sp. NPDC057623]